jgi:hypothetical protein
MDDPVEGEPKVASPPQWTLYSENSACRRKADLQTPYSAAVHSLVRIASGKYKSHDPCSGHGLFVYTFLLLRG